MTILDWLGVLFQNATRYCQVKTNNVQRQDKNIHMCCQNSFANSEDNYDLSQDHVLRE